MHCRKNFIDLTDEERGWLAAALNSIFDDGMIEHHAHHHEEYFFKGIHFGPAFLPWHRHMLLTIEQALQSFDARVMLPYWDWTLSQDLEEEPWKSFFGGRGGKGLFSNWNFTRGEPSDALPSLDQVIGELQSPTFTQFRAMEGTSHAAPHNWVNGTMATGASPRDPLFYLHHCNVDRLWAIWQRNHPTDPQYDCMNCTKVSDAYVDLNSPMVGGATPASMLDHLALGYSYEVDDRLEARVIELGSPAIVSGDPMEINLSTPEVVFNDVPEGDTTKRAILFEIAGCQKLTFSITNGPTAPFTSFEPGPFLYPQASGLPTEQLRIWLMYTGRAPGTVDTGVVSIAAHNEFGDEVQRWDDIPIIANSVVRPRVAVCLVLDESGSMLADAGYGRTRLDVLRTAATTFVDQLFDDNGLAMVSFAETGDKLTDLQTAGDMASAVRTDARNQIGSHGPPDKKPHTSIGAGLQVAADLYATAPNASDFDVRSTVVFTDGFQDRAPLIEEVRALINERVYAVGVGDAANVANDVLRAVANDTGGYMLVTGAIPQDDQFLLEKFFIQILVAVTNRDIVRDPDSWLIPNRVARVPFSIVRSDIAFDAIALSRAARYVALALQAPDGTVINQTQVAPDEFRRGDTASSFRVTLPVVIEGKEHWEGEWQLLLAILRLEPGRFSSGFGGGIALPFHALVHARSNLHLRATISQTGLVPGSQLNLRALITEYGTPIETHPAVVATMTRPDHTVGAVSFIESGPGEYDAAVAAPQAGVYRFHIQAAGLSSRGQAFTREQLLTAVVGFSSSQPTPGSSVGDDGKLCEFLKCLLGTDVLSPRFVRLVDELGIDLAHLRRCLEIICRPTSQHGVIK